MVEPSVEKVVIVEKSDEKNERDFDDCSNSDFHIHFESMPEDSNEFEDVDGNSNIERSMVASRAKVKVKVVVSSNKGKSKGVMIKKSVPTSTDKRKRIIKPSINGPGPSSKSVKTSRDLRFLKKELVPKENFLLPKKRRRCSQEKRDKRSSKPLGKSF